jgi:twitching motility two-component system response regulator PilH
MLVVDANVPQLRVLLIDDDAVTSELACVVLEEAGFDVRPARTLGEFNVLLTRWAPHVVVADVEMPGVTGPELCQWVKQREGIGRVAVVLFSSMPEPSLRELAERSGADAYISKARGAEHLSAKLADLCQHMIGAG